LADKKENVGNENVKKSIFIINQYPMTMLAPIIVFIMLILIIDLGRFRMNKGREERPVEKE
jgi:hypothetical protein